MNPIYLDSNASTPLMPEVWDAMCPYLTEVYGNPASAHRFGRRARQALEDARERLAACLDAFPDEVIFTSGATEANNLALFALAGTSPAQLIASPVEHPSVREPLHHLEKQGFHITWLEVGSDGAVLTDSLPRLLGPHTPLLTVMLANHETGTIQPVRPLVEIVAQQGSVRDEATAFHCDAVQAAGKIPVAFHDLGVTTLSLSAHKFHGPKGIGALLVRRNVPLSPRLHGGHQQQGRRPGTEPVALAVGMATALELACQQCNTRLAQVHRLRHILLDHLCRTASPVVLNGPATEGEGLPHTLNLAFPGVRSDLLLMALDLAGVACSAGSACSSGSLLPSPVLQAMRLPDDVLHSALRFSLHPFLSEAEVETAARCISKEVNRLRAKISVR